MERLRFSGVMATASAGSLERVAILSSAEFNLRNLEFDRRYEVKEEGRNRLEEESKRF